MTVIECSQLTALRSRRCVALFRMSGKSMPVLSSIGGGFFSSSDGKITPIALPYTRLRVNLEEWTRGIDTRAESESAATAIHHPSSLQQSKVGLLIGISWMRTCLFRRWRCLRGAFSRSYRRTRRAP